ncbi:DoxX family protein [Catalinimonas niigatensis]|uniref:DoxX family protein n=1 Tax=Catalinimonas niigatensis TaxID=1397264 RepID=UPI002665D4FD|nr:hypothetical protein [Catalinimonas niigatensis]WPP50466.1 hypothetical protein PZB72_27750 [Catalinimonas niigatensis]
MKPFIVLVATFAIAVIIFKIIRDQNEWALAARIAMSVMLVFTASAHFVFTEGMTMMLPGFIPLKREVVYLTGILEIAAAIGLLIPGYRIVTAYLLILFFILILPANIRAALQHVDYQQATLAGNGLAYLWFRIPLQILFILWTYFSTIRH